MCLLAVLGSQGVVVKCTAAVFFHTLDRFCVGQKEKGTAGPNVETFTIADLQAAKTTAQNRNRWRALVSNLCSAELGRTTNICN